MFQDIESMLRCSKESGKALHEVILENEKSYTGLSEAEIYHEIECRYEVMTQSAMLALEQAQKIQPDLISGQSKTQFSYTKPLCGEFINRIMAMAFSSCEVNAGMGKICAAPTAGSCGILPAVLIEVSNLLGSDKQSIYDAFLVASGFGSVVMKNATISGAEGGCQAECGTAAAMAAAAAVYLRGGTNEMCAEAFSIALINCMGLICDPIAGLVQMPCSFRNSSQAVNAVISADMALAGQKCPIPADEVITSMYQVGRQLPSDLKETANGGIAASQTAKMIEEKIKNHR